MNKLQEKMRKFWRAFIIFPVIFAAVLLFAVCALFSGCYTITQGITMLGYLNRAVPLEKTDDREFIQLVKDIRVFATEELGLAESRNYTSLVQIDRNYLAAVVSASAKDSFRRHEWNYPVVGKMPYKGFFNIEGARKERKKLEKKDLDVWIRAVDAFSTLGWFKDPLFSYMRDYPPWRLADIIIHELVHATVFVKGQVQFNEELAAFIGTEGARLFLAAHYGEDSEEYRNMLSSTADNENYINFIHGMAAELDALYSRTDISREEKLTEKERVIKTAKERFDAEYENFFSTDDYRSFTKIPVNNAYLELYRLYYTEDNFYKVLYDKSGRDLPAFIMAAKTINKKGNPRTQLETALLQ